MYSIDEKLCTQFGHKGRTIVEYDHRLLQDDRMIQRTWGERFRLNRRHLKIRSVRLSDSGVIVCKGVNGFGSQSVALDLVVRGEQADFLPLGMIEWLN